MAIFNGTSAIISQHGSQRVQISVEILYRTSFSFWVPEAFGVYLCRLRSVLLWSNHSLSPQSISLPFLLFDFNHFHGYCHCCNFGCSCYYHNAHYHQCYYYHRICLKPGSASRLVSSDEHQSLQAFEAMMQRYGLSGKSLGGGWGI